MNEARKARRQRTFKGGKVVFADGSCVIDCIIRDMTLGGARLTFPLPPTLPENLELLIVAENRRQSARQVWQRGSTVGIRFA